MGDPQVVDQHVRLSCQSPGKLLKAEMHLTTDAGPINKRQWTTQPAKLESDEVTAAVPTKEVTAWFLTVTDERGAIISSRVAIHAAE